MSQYAFDPERCALLVSWQTAAGGQVATDIIVNSQPAKQEDALELVHSLNELADAMWEVHDRPVAEALEDDQETVRREGELQALRRVAEFVQSPRRPTDDGTLLVSYVDVDERANRVGRALDRMPALWREPAADDLSAEANAIGRAALGDLAGRAAQAVWRDRLEVSPTLFDAALRHLLEDPHEIATLPGRVGVLPAAAAAAVLLEAAASVAADASGELEPAEVFRESDDIEACSIAVPTAVVEALAIGEEHPADVVTALVREAVAVRHGRLPDLSQFLGKLTELGLLGAEWESRFPGTTDSLIDEALRLTELDPERPAADLWEHLLDGLGSAYTLFNEYFEGEGPPIRAEEDDRAWRAWEIQRRHECERRWGQEVADTFSLLVENLLDGGRPPAQR